MAELYYRYPLIILALNTYSQVLPTMQNEAIAKLNRLLNMVEYANFAKKSNSC